MSRRKALVLDPLEVVNRFIAAANRHDADGVAACVHREFESLQPQFPVRNFRGSAQLLANWKAIFRNEPGFRLTMLRSAVDDGTVWVELHGAGQEAEVAGIFIIGVENGLIRWARVYSALVEPAPVVEVVAPAEESAEDSAEDAEADEDTALGERRLRLVEDSEEPDAVADEPAVGETAAEDDAEVEADVEAEDEAAETAGAADEAGPIEADDLAAKAGDAEVQAEQLKAEDAALKEAEPEAETAGEPEPETTPEPEAERSTEEEAAVEPASDVAEPELSGAEADPDREAQIVAEAARSAEPPPSEAKQHARGRRRKGRRRR